MCPAVPRHPLARLDRANPERQEVLNGQDGEEVATLISYTWVVHRGVVITEITKHQAAQYILQLDHIERRTNLVGSVQLFRFAQS